MALKMERAEELAGDELVAFLKRADPLTEAEVEVARAAIASRKTPQVPSAFRCDFSFFAHHQHHIVTPQPIVRTAGGQSGEQKEELADRSAQADGSS